MLQQSSIQSKISSKVLINPQQLNNKKSAQLLINGKISSYDQLKIRKLQKLQFSQQIYNKFMNNDENNMIKQFNKEQKYVHSSCLQINSNRVIQENANNNKRQQEEINSNINIKNKQLKSGNLNISKNNLLQFNFSSYKLRQSYFTIQQLISQQNFSQIRTPQMIYIGNMNNNLRHGLGILITPITIYQGQFSLDHKNGKGYIEYPNKSKYYGDFSNDKPHGHGMLKYQNQYYIGDFENGTMNGDGMWKNMKNQKYIGKWKTNKAHGYGIYVTENSHYQGQFSYFTKQGYGIQTFPNGDIYKGNYLNGKPQGYGQYTWSSNIIYKGNFKQGLRQGQGVWKNQTGDVYQGYFHLDKKHGYGEYKWSNGNLYKGEFNNDIREGNGIMMWGDGSVYEGEWMKGLPNGKGMFKIKGEKPKYGYFEDNVLVEETKPPITIKSNKNTNKDNQSLQKSKLYLNVIPQFPSKRRNSHVSTSNTRKSASLYNKSFISGTSFKIGSARKHLTWKNR